MNKKSVELLNKAVADELTAIHQYLYFHFHLDDQGLDLLASLFKNTAIAEMAHVEKLAERILFLKGDVDMNPSLNVQKIKTVMDMIEKARDMEKESAKDYNRMAVECLANSDAVSRLLFEELIAQEESHYNRFDIELANIEKFGTSYLALQSLERAKDSAQSKR